jgi:hypothetical protein
MMLCIATLPLQAFRTGLVLGVEDFLVVVLAEEGEDVGENFIR